jgi:hypothetical protein
MIIIIKYRHEKLSKKQSITTIMQFFCQDQIIRILIFVNSNITKDKQRLKKEEKKVRIDTS